MKTKEYKITFKTEHSIIVFAESPEEAEQKAVDSFDGFCDWETEIEEVEE